MSHAMTSSMLDHANLKISTLSAELNKFLLIENKNKNEKNMTGNSNDNENFTMEVNPLLSLNKGRKLVKSGQSFTVFEDKKISAATRNRFLFIIIFLNFSLFFSHSLPPESFLLVLITLTIF